MKITIHRGQNQIGGSIIEIASDTAKIILDAGSELDEEIPAAPQIDGLFSGRAAYDAVFISHYHGDHLGLCDQVLSEIPIYIGKGAADVRSVRHAQLARGRSELWPEKAHHHRLHPGASAGRHHSGRADGGTGLPAVHRDHELH